MCLFGTLYKVGFKYVDNVYMLKLTYPNGVIRITEKAFRSKAIAEFVRDETIEILRNEAPRAMPTSVEVIEVPLY